VRCKRIIYFQWLILKKTTGKETQDVETINGKVIADFYSQNREIRLQLAHRSR